MKTFFAFLAVTAAIVSASTTAASMPALIVAVACFVIFLTVK